MPQDFAPRRSKSACCTSLCWKTPSSTSSCWYLAGLFRGQTSKPEARIRVLPPLSPVAQIDEAVAEDDLPVVAPADIRLDGHVGQLWSSGWWFANSCMSSMIRRMGNSALFSFRRKTMECECSQRSCHVSHICAVEWSRIISKYII